LESVRYLPSQLFVANTDSAWFDYLSTRATNGIVDEVNFWQPKSQKPMISLLPGAPVLFRLKAPHRAIAGFGFFAHFGVIDLDAAWATFGWKNGDPDRMRFFQRIGGYRRLDLLDPKTARLPLGSTVLREAHFWPRERWIPWGTDEGWHDNIVQGATVRDPAIADRLREAMYTEMREAPGDFSDHFELVAVDDREVRMREVAIREGQGSFRLRLLSAYEGQCAITGEHTIPVLDAAHIQPYLGAKSNHLQNGLVLTKEFHALFDAGYVGITPDYEVRVSDRLREEFRNGHRYYPFDGKSLVRTPTDSGCKPSRDALAWHMTNRFERTA
jgi:putative restriction endonuclease